MSKWDQEYLNLCEKIIKEGKVHHNRTGDDTIRIIGSCILLYSSDIYTIRVENMALYGKAVAAEFRQNQRFFRVGR